MPFWLFLIVGFLFSVAVSALITFIDSRVRFKKTSRVEALAGLVILLGGLLLTPVLILPFGLWGLLPIGVSLVLLVLQQLYIALFRPYYWEIDEPQQGNSGEIVY